MIPTSRNPGVAELTFEFEDLRLTDSVSTTALTVQRGSLSGSVSTRTGLNRDVGACSIKTSVASMTGLTWSDARLVLESDGNVFPRTVTSSSLEAQSGTRDDRTNFLAGTLNIDGAQVTLSPVALDPNFNAAHFEASYACKPKLQLVSSEEECSFTRPLAAAAARLLVQSVGTIGSMVNKDTSCGFDATLVKLRPDEVTGDPGEAGSMSWKIDGCRLGQTAPAQLDQDCNGARRMSSGTATIEATRTVRGLRERRLLLIDSIVPTTRQAVTVELTSVQLSQFSSHSLPAGASTPAARLTIHSGTLSAVVMPVLGERLSEPGTFDVPTPVSALTQVRLTNARVTLESGAKRFVSTIPSTELSAFNGSFLTASNSLIGSINIDGTPVLLDPMPLNPDFSQQAFNASYACTPDLSSVILPNGP